MNTKEELNQIKKRLDRHEERLTKVESFLVTKPKTEKKKLSIKEFILLKTPADDAQRTLYIGYYLENYDGLSCFNSKDLEEGFRKAKERVPININDKVNLNIKKGYMMEASGKKDNLKAWTLTNSGQKEVEELGEKRKTS